MDRDFSSFFARHRDKLREISTPSSSCCNGILRWRFLFISYMLAVQKIQPLQQVLYGTAALPRSLGVLLLDLNSLTSSYKEP